MASALAVFGSLARIRKLFATRFPPSSTTRIVAPSPALSFLRSSSASSATSSTTVLPS